MKVHDFAPLVAGNLIKRYKRYLADVMIGTDTEITCHCPNPGRMSSILPQPKAVYLTDLSDIPNPKRKLDYRWELAQTDEALVVVNTQLANRAAKMMLTHHPLLREKVNLTDAHQLRSEVSLKVPEGQKKTRFDFAVFLFDQVKMYIEVKQVSLRVADQDGVRMAAFPDAVTTRGLRHLQELSELASQGVPATLLYMVGRNDVDAVRPATEIDPKYSEALREAHRSGVNIIACKLEATLDGLYFKSFLPVQL